MEISPDATLMQRRRNYPRGRRGRYVPLRRIGRPRRIEMRIGVPLPSTTLINPPSIQYWRDSAIHSLSSSGIASRREESENPTRDGWILQLSLTSRPLGHRGYIWRGRKEDKFSSDLSIPARRIDPRSLPMARDCSRNFPEVSHPGSFEAETRSEPHRLQPMIPLIIYAKGAPSSAAYFNCDRARAKLRE